MYAKISSHLGHSGSFCHSGHLGSFGLFRSFRSFGSFGSLIFNVVTDLRTTLGLPGLLRRQLFNYLMNFYCIAFRIHLSRNKILPLKYWEFYTCIHNLSKENNAMKKITRGHVDWWLLIFYFWQTTYVLSFFSFIKVFIEVRK